MRNVTLAAIASIALGCAQSAPAPLAAAPEQPCDASILINGFRGLPPDATRVADRMASCMHFWGEYGGNDVERTAQLDSATKELRCDTIEADIQVMKKKYSASPSVMKALSCAAGE